MLRRSKNGGNWWEYFDWCGPYISDGKFQSSYPGYTTARSAQEQVCKEHDIAYYHCKSRECFEEADRKFRDDSWALGVFGKVVGSAVYNFGSYFHGDYEEEKTSGKRPAEETPEDHQKRLRGPPNLSGSKRPAPAASSSQSKARRRLDICPAPNPLRPDPHDPDPFKMADDDGPSNGTKGEIGLKPFGKIADTAPDYFTAKFKWVFEDNYQGTNGGIIRHEFRCNSPYDPSVGDTLATDLRRNSTVNGWAIYQQRYKYYRVVSSRHHISLHFPRGTYAVGASATDMENQKALDRWSKAVGVSINPGRIQPHVNAAVTSWRQLAQARYSDWKIIPGEGSAHFTVNYDPAAWATPVMEQQREQFWTPIDQNPLLKDTYTVWVQPLSRSDTMVTGNTQPRTYGHIIVYSEITVQFREWTQSMIDRNHLFDQRPANDTGESAPTMGETTEVMES